MLDENQWAIMGLALAGDRNAAEVEAAKLGFGGMLGIMSRWASATAIAERQCSVPGLSRM